jgi:hypothetical protein
MTKKVINLREVKTIPKQEVKPTKEEPETIYFDLKGEKYDQQKKMD